MRQGLLLLAAVLLPLGAAAAPVVADRVVIEKASHRLTLYAGGRRLAGYFVALGRAPKGRKVCRGDMRTPEGVYQVVGRKADSGFHRALRLSYPSPDDVRRAQALGCEPGGDIMIHGLKEDWGRDSPLHRLHDWTHGCVAVTNDEIEQIWRMVPDGTEVDIRP